MPSENQKLTIPSHVMARKVGEEIVLLNLDNEQYYGLDEVGTRMWEVLTTTDSFQSVVNILLEEYAVEAEQLRADLQEILDSLIAEGLLETDNK